MRQQSLAPSPANGGSIPIAPTSTDSTLTSALSLLGLEDGEAISDRNQARQLRRPRAVGHRERDVHVMRVTINATNVTVFNGSAPSMSPTRNRYEAAPLRPGGQSPALRGAPPVGDLSPPITPTNTPRSGNALGVHLPETYVGGPNDAATALRGGMPALATPLVNVHQLPPGTPSAVRSNDTDDDDDDDDDASEDGHIAEEIAPPAYPGNRLPWNPLHQHFVEEDPYHRGKWYVVTAGVRVGIWKAWVDMAHYVTNVRGNAHQAFKTLREAERWYDRQMREGKVVLLAP
ncbi:hypothetical protein C8Q76DRAFT_694569 [Earliella scabrosa]|nr:hypothetical protein C8Q76DRAFT_694569 [Earliella scabrosa]